MERRTFALVMLAALASPRRALAQAAKKVWRIGYLSMASPEADRSWVEAFRQGLRDLGYVEGQNLVLEERHALMARERLPELAADLVRRDVDVIVVYGLSSYPTLPKAVGGRPVIMTVHADPLGTGLVASLARPGGNLTGLTDGHADLAPKRLELLKEAVPSVSRVGVLFNPKTGHAVRQWKLAEAAGPAVGVTIVPIEIKGAQDAERAFESTRKARIDGLIFAPDPTWWVGQQRQISRLAITHRLPTVASVREFAENGILIAYGTNFAELWRRSATYVDKIFKGAKPGDLPIEHPTKFDLVINLKTAKALGITVPRAGATRRSHHRIACQPPRLLARNRRHRPARRPRRVRGVHVAPA
jgi:putative ABC transport system substrate-binding protein